MADRRTILIADGSPNTVPKLTAAMDKLGYEIMAVGDALFVQTMALRHKPAAVILGNKLPAGGSLTALNRLRASVHTASIPVIALATAGAQKQALVSAGVEACLEPPVAEGDILTALEKHLGMARTVTEAPKEILHDPARLSALCDTRLMDGDPDEELDILTRLAARALAVPVALVSLVDDRRQFFKSQVGLPHPWDGMRQTPLSHSFCQWVVTSQEELVITDARTHPVLRTSRAIAELGVVAYAGAPLSAVNGQSIGSFCAIDCKPRSWDDGELATLRDLALVVDAHFALYSALAPDLQTEDGASHVRAATRAASRGFLGIARLLRRGRPLISDDDRRELGAVIERHSHQMIQIAADPIPAAVAQPPIAVGAAL